MAWGEYPPEYNRAVHGTYCPSRWYGKPDTNFGQVKLAELPAWFGRRNKHPLAACQAVGRAWWRWRLKYIDPFHSGIAGYAQLSIGLMAFFYIFNYERINKHKQFKYHW